MDEREFVAGGRDAWERLANEVRDARALGVTRIGPARLRSLHEDYRRAAADLAYAQTHYPGSPTHERLNRLVAAAHAEIHGRAPRRLGGLLTFFTTEYPRLLRRRWRPIALAATLLLASGVFGYLAARLDYGLARLLLPPQLRDTVADGVARRDAGAGLAGPLAPMIGAYIGINNVQVAIAAFAGGMSFGVLTVYAMLSNGALVGVLAGVFSRAGLDARFWALIVPHGSLEIPAITIAAGAGFRLAGALVFPGDVPRMVALRRAAPDAVRLFLGTVPLFAVAAVVEAFFTPAALPEPVKYAGGIALFAALVAYVTLAGRSPDARRGEPDRARPS